MKFSETQPILAAYSYLQHGLVTAAQASKEGINTTTLTRLAQADHLRRIRRGVYILSSVAEDPLTEVRAAWLSTRPEMLADDHLQADSPIVISHASAASVLELGDITPSTHTFTSSNRKQSSAADITHRTAPLSPEEWYVVDGIPVTTVTRTITDLAKDHLDGDQLLHIIADAIHNHRANPSEIALSLARYATNYGYPSGEELVADSLQHFPGHPAAAEAKKYEQAPLANLWTAAAQQAAASLLMRDWAPEIQAAHSQLAEAIKKLAPSFPDIARQSALLDKIQESLDTSQLIKIIEASNHSALMQAIDRIQSPKIAQPMFLEKGEASKKQKNDEQ